MLENQGKTNLSSLASCLCLGVGEGWRTKALKRAESQEGTLASPTGIPSYHWEDRALDTSTHGRLVSLTTLGSHAPDHCPHPRLQSPARLHCPGLSFSQKASHLIAQGEGRMALCISSSGVTRLTSSSGSYRHCLNDGRHNP